MSHLPQRATINMEGAGPACPYWVMRSDSPNSVQVSDSQSMLGVGAGWGEWTLQL